ncbi:Imm50 family immunity protein [Streptomyces sp. NPDC088766]|uniref:Imm50 family immunity protein n=1 Tax=Streptomyces sp. NPDC088766 TaxID=3365893 RepID=UPI0037FC22FA
MGRNRKPVFRSHAAGGIRLHIFDQTGLRAAAATQDPDLPPAPEKCDLFYVHIDERGDSVTLGFETVHLPSHPLPEWSEKPYNRLEFYLLFCGVTEIAVAGWTASEAESFGVSAVPEKEIAVRLGRDQAGMRFRASSVRLANTRVYLAAESP